MKFLIVCALISIAVAMPFTEEQIQKGQEHVKKCIAETGVDPADVQKLKAGDFSANNEKAQCFAKCFFEKAGFMDSNGNLQEEVIITKLSSDKPKDKVEALVNKCKGEAKGATSCETAFKAYECFRKSFQF